MINFNGETRGYLKVSVDSRRPSWAPVIRNIVKVPGRAGGYTESTDVDVRVIPLNVTILNKNTFSSLQKLKEDLANWLITDEPKELILPDETDRVYFAAVDGSFDPEEIVNIGKGTITFICADDPYKYGLLKGPLPLDAVDPSIIRNDGTVETKPVFRFNILQPMTYLDIVTDDDYMAIGEPVTTEEVPFKEFERVLYDEMETIVGWGNSNITPDGGVKAGTMTSTGQTFTASSYGTGVAWHGPVLQRNLEEPLTDYHVRARFSINSKDSRERSRGEFYLVAEDGTQMGKLAVVNNDTTRKTSIEVKLQNGADYTYPVNRRRLTLGFYGKVTIIKKGNKFSFTIATEDTRNGKTYVLDEWTSEFLDIENRYTKKLAAVAVHVGTYASNPLPRTNNLRSLLIDRVNTQQDGVPYIVDEGDEVIIDHKNELILINGEPRTDLKNFGANYFSLKPGDNIIVTNPPGYFDATIEWRDCYR